MMEAIRFGLIGYGKVAQLHAKALSEATGARLISVCGRNKTRRDQFASAWNIASRDNVYEMVALDHVDAVIITSPHPQHRDHTLEALDAGCHVLVEKPMALREAECTEMIQAAQRSGKYLSVVSQRRWYPSSMRIIDAINAGKIGRPAIGMAIILGWRDEAYYQSDPWRGRWDTEGGGVCINQAPHQFDLLHWFMGPVERIQAEWENVNHPYIEVEDSAVASIRFANGALGSILVSNSQKPGIYAKVHVHGTSGASVGVQTDSGAMFIAGRSTIAEPPVNDLWTIPGEESLLATFVKEDTRFFSTIDATTYFFTRQIEDFVRAVQTNTRPLVSGEDGRETVRIIEGIYRSGRTHQSVEYS
ncbi:MAG: Gfo/Idh/MocA family oxidoreductase [Sphaerochaetaceae bacterium]|jgi:predicted dehydrogenase|nr:Gfo/Idh/MocA family oxidoreductase [Sphaerochaetaceae bacterium]